MVLQKALAMVFLMKSWMNGSTKLFLVAIKKPIAIIVDWTVTFQKWGIPVISCENFVGSLTALDYRDMLGDFF
jgi:hypothetical protein